MYTNSDPNSISYTRKGSDDDDQMRLVADCLESLRTSAQLRAGLSRETRGELEEYLALAEAALRRAHAEQKFS